MKNISTLLLAILILASCNKTKDYVTLSGTIDNNKDSLVLIINNNSLIKKINIDSTGYFKDTLKVDEPNIYTFATSREKMAPIYLKNGFDLTIKGDANEFLNSFKFSGKGAINSNFVLAQMKQSEDFGNPAELLNLEEKEFDAKINAIKTKFDSIFNAYSGLDSTLAATTKEQNSQMVGYFKRAYLENKATKKGSLSPKFENYVDFKGGTKSLDDFKGKYVYIDVWATWCGPCIQQIPFLKKLEKEYHNKNIEFISISTDESNRSGGSWEAAENKWRTFVKKRELTGVQLWSGKDFSFQQAYRINGIPRFILIDPAGKIVSANAPRPSDPALKQLFNSLNI